MRLRLFMVFLSVSFMMMSLSGCEDIKGNGIKADKKAAIDIIDNGQWTALEYKSSPVDNPLKGFMPYSGSYTTFPYSMEWFYVPLCDLMDGPQSFTFDKGLEPLLDSIASRGHQAVFRVYLDYPKNEKIGVPGFLTDGGLKFNEYTEYGGGKSPDYTDPKLIEALTKFIAAFGEKYDGDPRIGFITVGLVGFWGEWHTYPHQEWMPSIETQRSILEAYDKAFNKTKLLVRYPDLSTNADLSIGYHDDSFAFQTLPDQAYNFMSLMEQVGATEKWKSEPIGGELRPEVQPVAWDLPQNPIAQDYNKCVELTHASFLMNHEIFISTDIVDDRYKRALDGAKKLGYELYVPDVKIQKAATDRSFKVELKIRNTGVAPFYYDWKVQLGVVDIDGQLKAAWETDWKLSSIIPGVSDKVLSFIKDNHGLPKGNYKLAMRVPNPVHAGNPLRFANGGQDKDLDGWLTLDSFEVK